MEPEPKPEKPGDAYARALKDRIVRDARPDGSAWVSVADPGFRITPRLVIGLAIMLAGFLLAVDSLGFVDAERVLRYWPIVLVAVGITKLLGSEWQRSGAFVWIVAGAALLALNLGLLSFPRVAAIVLFLVGARIAWRSLAPGRAPALVGQADLDVVAVLGGSKRGATDFRGGQVLAFMGGCEIDLRRAAMEKDEAALDLFVFWGGAEIKVPEDWEVTNRGLALLGGFVDNTRHPATAQKRLVLTGMAIMGGVEVKN